MVAVPGSNKVQTLTINLEEDCTITAEFSILDSNKLTRPMLGHWRICESDKARADAHGYDTHDIALISLAFRSGWNEGAMYERQKALGAQEGGNKG